MSSATKNIDKKRQSATSTENRSSLRSVTNGQRSEGIASSRTSHGSVAGQESLFPLQLTRLHKHKSSITRKISHRRLPASSDLQQQECSAGSSRFQNSIQVKELFRRVVRRAVICLHWLSEVFYHIRRENFLEHQLIQIFDKSKGAEHTLSLKQLELAGTVFNKHNYKARNQSFLNREIEYILTTPSHTRTAEELSLVLNSLQSVKSFSEFPTHVQQLLCQVSWFQRVPPRKVIIRQGQKGLNFYFVISGSGVVKVLRRRTDDTIMNKQLVVARVHPGSSFGDIALLHNVERTATVESVTEMCLLVVGREDYKKIFLQRGILQEHLNFLKSVNSLKHWPVEKLNESRSDCIFHYFRRGKVIVADSNNSDFLYVVKSGSCEVIKDIPDISTYANRKRLKAQVKENDETFKPKKQFQFRSLPELSSNLNADADKSRKDFLMQKKRNPSLMMDVPVILHKDLQDLQKKMANEQLSSKPALPLIVQKLMVKHKLTKIQQDSKTGKCAESKLSREESGTKTGCEDLSSVSEKQLHKRSLQKRKTTYIEDTKNRVTVTSSKSLKKSTDLLDIKENVNSSTKPLYSGGNLHNTELPESADNSHITELPKSADNSHKTELPKSADNSHKTELPKSADNSHKTELLKSGDNPHNMELPKTRITLVAKMWKAKAVDASNKYFKELHGAKELNSQLSQNQQECHAPPVLAVSTEQEKEQTTQVFMSHEGSEQMVVNRQNPSADTVFVRLGLLISKDVFGLETLKFDVNYKVSDTSVCLVSRGAEVLMIRKKFFMDHCNSANLEHLRNTISPYPTEISMQRNLQVSFDWNRYSKQQVKDILDGISLKKSCKTSYGST